MGHELVRFDFPGWPDEADADWQRFGKPRTNERLLSTFRAALRQGPLDLFFGYFYSSVVFPETIDLIHRSGVPTVNFSCNNVHQFGLVRDIAPRFDVCVVPELAALADFKAAGAVPVRIQLAANPRVYRPYPEPRLYDVTFVGQRYADRADFLDFLKGAGVDVRAWGAGWQTHKRLDLAHARAALALFEDERLDGIRRLVRRRLTPTRAAAARIASLAPVPERAPGFRHDRSATHRPEARVESSTPAEGTGLAPSAEAEVIRSDAVRGPTDPRLGQASSPRSTIPPSLGVAAERAQRYGPPGAREDPGYTSARLDTVDTSSYGGPRLLQTDLIKTFSQSRISLGFATAGASHLIGQRLTHLRLREFEAPMSGALYLTEDQPELAEYFEPGTEVLTYVDRQDLLDKARYYLAHQEAAERIRRAGLCRARQEHTWQHRFRELFGVLGLRARP